MPVKRAKDKVRASKDKFAIVLLCLGMGLFGGGGVVALDKLSHRADKAVNTAQEIRSSLIEGCERNNRLRKGLRGYFADEIEQTKFTDPELFPDIPKPVFKQLVRESIIKLRYNINQRFKDIDCKEEYGD